MTNDLDFSILQEQPVDFIELAFGDQLWEKQRKIAESVRDFKYTSVRSSHGSGKSFSAARIALWYLYSFPNSKVITTAPTMRQVEDILWREIRSAKAHSRIQLGGHYTNTGINLSEQWFAMGLSTDEPDRFQGFHAVDLLLIVDEAAGVTEDIFNASEGVVSSQHARVLYLGNPTNTSGTFYQSFKMPGYAKIHISAFDTPNFTTFGITLDDIKNNAWEAKITAELPAPYLITPDWVYDKYLRWGEGNPMWDSRVMGNFPEQGEDSLIPLARIEEAARRTLAVKEEDAEQIGVDVARFGTDSTILTYRKGPKVFDTRSYNHMDTMETVSRVRDFAGLYPNAIIAVDEVGVGAGVVDRLQQLFPDRSVYGVNVGQSAFDSEQFANLRAELFWGLRERFIQGDIDLSSLPPDEFDALAAEASQIKYKYSARNQVQIEKKEEMKKRGLSSPDRCLAQGTLILTNAGYLPIEQVKAGDHVVTPLGTRRVLAAGMTNPHTPVMRVRFSNGTELVGTGNHKIITRDLPLALDALTLYNEIYTDSIVSLLLWRFRNLLHIKARNTGFRQRIQGTTLPTTEQTASATRNLSTMPSGSTITDKPSPRDSTFTILTETLSIIRLKIWLCFQHRSTGSCTSSNGSAIQNTYARTRWHWISPERRPRSGMGPLKDTSFINGWARRLGRTRSYLRPHVSIARRGSKLTSPLEQNSVRIGVSRKSLTPSLVGSWKRLARSVTRRFRRINIGLLPVVVTHVQTDFATLPVYNLTVEKDNVYYANGILVSNCDSLALAFGRLKHSVSYGWVDPKEVAGQPPPASIAFPTTSPQSQWDLSDPEQLAQAERELDLAILKQKGRGVR